MRVAVELVEVQPGSAGGDRLEQALDPLEGDGGRLALAEREERLQVVRRREPPLRREGLEEPVQRGRADRRARVVGRGPQERRHSRRAREGHEAGGAGAQAWLGALEERPDEGLTRRRASRQRKSLELGEGALPLDGGA